MTGKTRIELFESMAEMGHEQVVFSQDASCGYRGIVAIHSTVLGPAVGGTRFWKYASEEEALVDALRLSRGMTYKCAVAGLPWGGGKSIILDDGKPKDREKLFRAHGRFIDRLGGRYVTAEDVGTSPADMELIALETSHVGGLIGKGGDPSPWTALGVFRAMQASAQYRWGGDDLRGKRVAIQGCGNVGLNLAKQLREAGAPDYVANSGGVLSGGVVPFGFTLEKTRANVLGIYDTLLSVFAIARADGIPTHQAADRVAERRLREGALSSSAP
jgi:leucine dehydrogenase